MLHQGIAYWETSIGENFGEYLAIRHEFTKFYLVASEITCEARLKFSKGFC